MSNTGDRIHRLEDEDKQQRRDNLATELRRLARKLEGEEPLKATGPIDWHEKDGVVVGATVKYRGYRGRYTEVTYE